MNAGVRGELGQFPLLTTLLPGAIKYWMRVCSSDSPYLVKMIYQDSLENIDKAGNWATCIKKIVAKFISTELWVNQGSLTDHSIVKICRLALEKHKSLWEEHINDSTNNTKLRSYKLFKNNFEMENYLLFDSSVDRRRILTKLRLSCHNLRIETGRHCYPKIPAEQRLCRKCESGKVEDEKHFLLDCQLFNDERSVLFDTLSSFTEVENLSPSDQFTFLFSYGFGDHEIYKEVIKFVCSAYTKNP